MVTRVTNRMQSIVSSAHPSLLGEAMWFFPKLDEKTREYIDLGVDWSALNEWFASIVRLMAKPTTRFRVGDAGPPTVPLVLDVSWFDERSEFERKIERAVQISIGKHDRSDMEPEPGDGSRSTKKSRGGDLSKGMKREFERMKSELATIKKSHKIPSGKGTKGKAVLLPPRKAKLLFSP